MNACPMRDDFEVADPEDDIDTRVNKMKLLNETVCIWIIKLNEVVNYYQNYT